MALGNTIVAKFVAGNLKGVIADIALDATYAAGGYVITPAAYGLSTIHFFHGYMKTGDNLLPNYNHTLGKLEILKGASTVTVTTGSAAFSELATNDTLASATVVVRALIIGDLVNVG